MRKAALNQNIRWCVRTPEASLVKGCAQALVFCIAFPLACFVVVFKGVRLLYRLLMSLSFTCCVWIFLTALIFLFLLVFAIQFAVASMG